MGDDERFGVVDFDKLRGLIETGSSGVVDVRAELERARAEIDWNAQRARLQASAPPADEADQLLTYAEAAEFLRCKGKSQSYVETAVRQGKLRAVTLPATDKGSGEHARQREGRARRIWLSDLKAFAGRKE